MTKDQSTQIGKMLMFSRTGQKQKQIIMHIVFPRPDKKKSAFILKPIVFFFSSSTLVVSHLSLFIFCFVQHNMRIVYSLVQ